MVYNLWTHGTTSYHMPIATLIGHYESLLEPDPIGDLEDYNYFYRDLRYRLDKGFLFEPISPETHAKCDAYAKKNMQDYDNSVKERIASLKEAQEKGVTDVTLSSFEFKYFCQQEDEEEVDDGEW